MADDSKQPGAREFVFDTTIVAVTQLLLRLRGVVTLPIIVKLMGTASYGIFTQVIAVAGLGGALLAWNLHLAMVRFMVADRARWGTVYLSLLAATLASIVGGGALLAAFAEPLGRVLIGGVDGASLLLIALGLVLAANVRQLNLNVYRATHRFVVRSAVELATTFGEVAGIYVLIRTGHGLRAAFLFALAWELAAALATTAHALTITGRGAIDLRVVRQGFAYSLPLIPASLAIWILDRADRFVVNAYLGASGVGVYSANYTLASLVLFFQTPFQMTLFPKVSSLWDVDRARAVRYISLSNRAYLTLAIPFAVGAAALAPQIFVWLGNAEIAGESDRITLLLEAGVVLWGVAVMIMQALYAAHRTVVIGVVTLAAAVVNLGLNFLLVPLFGVLAAAAATLVAYLLVCLALAIVVAPLARIAYDPGYLLKCCVAAAAMGALLRLAQPRTPVTLVLAAAGGVVVYALGLAALRGLSRNDLATVRDLLRRR